jgi:hypothetical protein
MVAPDAVFKADGLVYRHDTKGAPRRRVWRPVAGASRRAPTHAHPLCPCCVHASVTHTQACPASCRRWSESTPRTSTPPTSPWPWPRMMPPAWRLWGSHGSAGAAATQNGACVRARVCVWRLWRRVACVHCVSARTLTTHTHTHYTHSHAQRVPRLLHQAAAV